MLPRFYAPDLHPESTTTALPPDEALHLTRVLRLGQGARIAVFDGRGREFLAVVAAASRDRVQVDLVERVNPVAEARVPLTLVQAVLKGDKMDDVVRDATMMGVAAIDPIVTAHSIARTRDGSGRGTERWSRVAVSSAKQCRRATVPAIARAQPYSEWLATGGPGLRLILVEPSGGGGSDQSLHLLEDHAPAALALLVGPEGGWSEEEREEAEKAGCIPVTLGALTLRADAVAVAAIAMVRFALRDL
jgi:16S rRNA (uracil1498-N3)-methyltransferase